MSTLTAAEDFFLRLRWERFAPEEFRGCLEGLVPPEGALPVRAREPEVDPLFASPGRRTGSEPVRVGPLTDEHIGIEPLTVPPICIVDFAPVPGCVEDLMVVPVWVENLTDCVEGLPTTKLAIVEELIAALSDACTRLLPSPVF